MSPIFSAVWKAMMAGMGNGSGKNPIDQTPAGICSAEDLELAGVIHDVNQMLAVILGRTGLLLRRGQDVELEKNLRTIELAARDAATMLARVNGYSESAADEDDPLVPLRQTAAESGMLISPAGGSGWEEDSGSKWSLKNDIPADLATDIPSQVVREVINNLLLNSLEAGLDGIRIRISGQERENRVVLVFIDDGPGLPETARANLFQPGTSSSGQPGRGIGLAGCRALLQKWGGDLHWVESMDSGAMFELDLPKASPRSPGGQAVTTTAGKSTCLDRTTQPRRSVLIVEDELTVREMLEEVMTELGCTVTLARDSDQALDIFAPGTFDLAFLDQSLPGLQGQELAGLLRQQDSAVAIVLFSGWGREKVLAEVDTRDVDLTATKPLELSKMMDLLSAGSALVDRRRADGNQIGDL